MSGGEGNVCARHPMSGDPNPAVRASRSRGIVREAAGEASELVKFFVFFPRGIHCDSILIQEAAGEQEVKDPLVIE
jgi:hypothetical protein